jgi:hypothetical protein
LECCGISFDDGDDEFLETDLDQPSADVGGHSSAACAHPECVMVRAELSEPSRAIRCQQCCHDFGRLFCYSKAFMQPVLFVRGWSGACEYKTVGNFLGDPPVAVRGEAIRCMTCAGCP